MMFILIGVRGTGTMQRVVRDGRHMIIPLLLLLGSDAAPTRFVAPNGVNHCFGRYAIIVSINTQRSKGVHLSTCTTVREQGRGSSDMGHDP